MSRKGAEFTRFFVPLLESLKALGGSGTASEVIDHVLASTNIPEKELEVVTKSGVLKVRNQVYWARHYLVRVGFISSSVRGVWALTAEGESAELSESDISTILRKVDKEYRENLKKRKAKEAENATDEDDSPESEESSNELLDLLKSLSPDGFERICQRLLRESGFQQVIVTGKSGDGGIDGSGILEINPLVSFNVSFQCKRYKDSVGPGIVRDFRGAMQGRADKGIIITTGSFTREAKKEARRDGATPIEIVDGEKLVNMFQNLQLGVIPTTVFKLDESFFESFK